MDELVKGFGNAEGLRLEVAWDTMAPAGTAAEATRGSLRLSIRGGEIWRGAGPGTGFPWTWIELLEFLANGWPYLAWEDGLPFGLRPDDPSLVRAQAENRWLELPADAREEEEATFEAFEQVHDLARGVRGALLPSVWIVREGVGCWVSGGGRKVLRPLTEVLETLQGFGDEVVRRLGTQTEPRAQAGIEAWKGRTRLSVAEGVAIATGLSRETLAEVDRNGSPEAAWDVEPDRFELNELLAAARMAVGLGPRSISGIVTRIRRVSPLPTPELDRIAGEARPALEASRDERPYDQGHALATWLRERLGISRELGRLDPSELLDGWDVRVVDVRLDVPEVDAFACWGPKHGPAVFVNVTGRHRAHAGGRNASLAHEVCHLLVDRGGALPLAEVLGGRTSPLVEARARAFAAELLLPRRVAGEAMAGAGNDPSRALSALTRRHGVSRELAAWQARNSGVPLSRPVLRHLREQVSRPSEF